MWILCAHTGQWREAEKSERESAKKEDTGFGVL